MFIDIWQFFLVTLLPNKGLDVIVTLFIKVKLSQSFERAFPSKDILSNQERQFLKEGVLECFEKNVFACLILTLA